VKDSQDTERLLLGGRSVRSPQTLRGVLTDQGGTRDKPEDRCHTDDAGPDRDSPCFDLRDLGRGCVCVRQGCLICPPKGHQGPKLNNKKNRVQHRTRRSAPIPIIRSRAANGIMGINMYAAIPATRSETWSRR
jgi:hypothetical protein